MLFLLLHLLRVCLISQFVHQHCLWFLFCPSDSSATRSVSISNHRAVNCWLPIHQAVRTCTLSDAANVEMVQICAECRGVEVRTPASSAGAMFKSQPRDWLSLPLLWFFWDLSDQLWNGTSGYSSFHHLFNRWCIDQSINPRYIAWAESVVKCTTSKQIIVVTQKSCPFSQNSTLYFMWDSICDIFRQ
jgi:hypothetical protein